MRYGYQSSSDGARFKTTIRALLFSCASFCYMPRWNHTSSNRNIHRKSTLHGEKENNVFAFKLLSDKLNKSSVPELATELNAVLSTKADGHPIWRWSFLPDWSAAQRAQLSPTRYTHMHADADAHTHTRKHTEIRSHTYTGRSLVCGTGGIVSIGASYGQLYFYFYATAFHKNTNEKRPPERGFYFRQGGWNNNVKRLVEISIQYD